MKSIEAIITHMESKGHAEARAIINELVDGGALTDYDAAKYMARQQVLREAARSSDATRTIVARVADRFCIGRSTLLRTMGLSA